MQKEAPPGANFRGTLMSYALRRNQFVSRVFTISSVIAPSQNSWGQFCCALHVRSTVRLRVRVWSPVRTKVYTSTQYTSTA